jgi:DNA-binding GntR family transcriptional regulator
MPDQHADKWARLEAILTSLKPGEAVALDALATDTGLSRDLLRTILVELTRSEMFTQHDDHTFVRHSPWQRS